MQLQYRPDTMYNAREAKHMYKSHTRRAFTCLSKGVCTPGETRLHRTRKRVHYTLHLGNTVSHL